MSEVIVTAEHDQSTHGHTQAEEHLSGGRLPYLTREDELCSMHFRFTFISNNLLHSGTMKYLIPFEVN